MAMAQRLVVYTRAGHRQLAAVREAATAHNISKGLASSNATRMTSMHL